jgi:hypothetical protein
MINIHDELFDEVDHSEFWLLCHIVKRLNKDLFCFPSNKLLMVDTGWSIDKLQKVKKSLQDKGLLKVEARFNSDRQTSNTYYLTTNLIGAFIGGDQLTGWKKVYPPEKSTPLEEKTGTASPPEKTTTEVLTSKEVLSTKVDSQKGINSECYKPFIEVWHKKYPGLLTMPKDGAKVKSIIKQVFELLAAEKWEISPTAAINLWTILVENLHRTWGHNKDLSTIDSKLKSLFFELKEGRKISNARGAWETEFQELTKY